MTTMVKDVAPHHTCSFESVNMFIYHANPGEGVYRHEHLYPHATMVNAGRILVRKENLEIILDKFSEPVVLKGSEWHEIEALDEGTVFINVSSATHGY